MTCVTTDKMETLHKWLNEEDFEISIDDIRLNLLADSFKVGVIGGYHEYLVLTDEEAEAAAAEYIKQNLWAMRPGFLASYTSLSEQSIMRIQRDSCEDANDVFLELLTPDSLEELINDAILNDGRGAFLATYDHHEAEYGNYYIYRTN